MGYLLLGKKSRSLNLLYPLLGLPRDANVKVASYCWWENSEEGIDEYQLLILLLNNREDIYYKNYERKILTKDKNLVNYYECDKGQLCVFSLLHKKEAVDAFIEGRYSQIPEADKRVILNYWNEPHITYKCEIVNDVAQYPRHVFLYPEYYFADVAEELGISEEEMISVGELWGAPDRTAETLKCSIVPVLPAMNYDELVVN